jgi:NitT/TauT family transport system substrate-binding protein
VKAIWLFFGVFLVASTLSACGTGTPAARMDTLKMALSHKIGEAPIFIAEAEGYFAQRNIQMEYVTLESTKKALPLLVSGDVDIYAGSITAGLLNTLYTDKNIKAVADRGRIAAGGCTYMAILIRKDLYDDGRVAQPGDLAGLTFSGSTAGTGAYLLSTYLARGGLTFKDIRIVGLETQSEIEAYANKAIDGSIASEPDLSSELGSGKAVILVGPEDLLGDLQTGIIAFNRHLLADNPELGARFLAAYLEGVRQYNQGKTERNLRILADATGAARESLETMCWPLISNDARIDFAALDGFQRWSVAQGQLDNPVTEDQFWDPTLLIKAQALTNP